MTIAKHPASAPSLPSRHRLNVGLNVGGIAIPALAGIAAVPALVSQLGQERFATLALGWTLVGYFSVLDLGLGRALTLHMAREARSDASDPGSLARAARRMMLGLGLLWAMLLLAALPLVERHWPHLSDQSSSAFVAWAMLVLCIPATLWLNSSASVLEARSRFVEVNAVRIPLGVATYAAPLVASLVVQDMGWMFASLLLTRVAGASVLAFRVRDAFHRAAGPASASSLRELLRFGGWMTVSQVVGPVLVYFDRFAIAALVSAAAVTHYAVPFDVLSRLPLFPMAVMAVLFPLFVQAQGALEPARAGQGRATAQGTVRLLLAAWLPAMAMAAFYGPDLLRLWVGDPLASASAPVWNWLIVGVAVNGLAHVPLTLLQSKGRTDLIAGLHLVELAPYLLAVWWALERHGIAGAAAVWTARVALDAVLLHACAGRLSPEWRGLLRVTLGASLLMAAALGALAWSRG